MIENAAVRRRTMQAVRSKDTKPEIAVRHLVRELGYRYRLHRKDLPGKPDLAFIGRRKIIFVHGCFWHGHMCARGKRLPKTNSAYWQTKISRNCERDAAHAAKLKGSGWAALVVWECELKKPAKVATRIRRFLDMGVQ
jgi:DNA mismatch endonuclease (patch repair protein)